MTDSTWTRLQELFEQALELPVDERQAFLDDACGDDEELRADVEVLLRADERNSGFSDEPPDLGVVVDSDAQLIGETVGGWRILERVGVGGMGSVFLAERADGEFEQQAAVKIVRKGMDSDSVVQRFRQERQILARLNHPNIAGVLDGGVTDDGRPYFAMEFVDGLPITDFCDEHRLGVEERLELFRKACDAVHYAHRNLVVHRDLKPSNILVTRDGDVRLLDFGIAKVLDEPEDQNLTRTGMQVHTPAYAAPEQLMSEPITTATDVYALGVVLYELLSGRRPFEVRRTPSELRELVLTGDPPKPSTAVLKVPANTDGRAGTQTIEELSSRRGERAERLRRLLRGDLDTICLMALHREPNHRYASADQMADDIRRHLEGLPVVASPDSLAYRIGKFYRRHRSGVISTIGVIVAFIVMSAVYTVRLAEERNIALDEQRKAEEVVDFVTGLFAVSDPSESRGEEITARDLLDAGAEQIRDELVDRPEVQSMMRRVLGEVYHSLGAFERSEALLVEALEQQLAVYGDEHLETATTKILVAFIHQNRGEYEIAQELMTEALATRRSIRGGDHDDVMEAISALAYLKETMGDYAAAEALFVEALDMGRRMFADDDVFLAEAMANLAGLYRFIEKNTEAEELLREALAMQNRLYGGPHPESDDTKRKLAGLLRDTGSYEESQRLYLEVIESRTRMLGEDHLEVAHSWNSYSQLLSDMGEFDAALEANQTFIDIMERVFDGPHPSLGAAYNNRATMLDDVGDDDGAIEHYQRSIEMQNLTGLPERHPNRSYPLSGLASMYLKLGRFDEAEPIYDEVLSIRRENFSEEHTLVNETRSALGAVYTGQGRYEEAEPLLLGAYELFLETRGAEHVRTQRAAYRLSVLYTAIGDEERAADFNERAGPGWGD
ncbi:MAG: tetratricopeptide repeat-containing serine/threonine-protein kinase [Woeseiaceae bacterium]|nr:tetratricopeptide repeat-containing serine/threonine-protein kinase [Woeseiaceae bacterium]